MKRKGEICVKKLFCQFLTVALCLFLAAPCFSLSAIGYDSETEGRKWEENAFFKRMERLTGVHVEGSACGSQKEWAETLANLRNGTADILLKADLSRTEEKALLDAGILIDLSPYLEACMPNLSALLYDNPKWREQIALEDGRIASLPEINIESRQVIVWINTRWLENLSLEMPRNIDELGTVLQAFRDGDPNGNGKQDEIPCDFIGMWELRWLLPYFGIACDDWMIGTNSEGTLYFVPESDAYRVFTETMADWYGRGLLRADTFTQTHSGRVYLSDAKTENAGMFVSVSPVTHIPPDHVMDYSALLIPWKGKTVWRKFPGEIWNGCFAVTSRCGTPEEALRWADALYAEDAAILSLAGEEGTDWEWNGDGTWSFITRDGRTTEEICRSSIMNTGIKMPGLYPVDFASSANSREDQWIAKENRKARIAAYSTETVHSLAPELKAQAASVIADLLKCTDEGTAEFIIGAVPLNDENWKMWLDRLRTLGSEQLTAAFEIVRAEEK